ncbi:CdaR family protein [Prevotella sp. HUN102]|uniref:CdaR family protein n=1 Tax=Prevotella sp. HUN102 TaxID=1392486 RepID=UPI00048FCD57|nr:YbbR-like domain-containing protein [Prevotella sp. HUN102]
MVGDSLNIFDKVRNLLLKIFNKEFLIFLFFLALSGLFWLSNTLDDTYEKEIPIDIRLTGIPKNVVLTSEVDSTIRVTIKDKGYILAMYLFSKEIRPLTFDFSTYRNLNNSGEITIAEIQKLLGQQLYSSTKITAVKSNNLSFTFNYGQHKKVSVKISGMAIPAEGYFLTRVQFTPDSVTVYAEKELLDSIREAYTESQEILNFTEMKELNVNLRKIKNAKFVPNTVKMQLYPDVLIEETVEVPIKAINVPEDKVMRVFPGKIKVVFAAGTARVKAMPKNIETQQILPDGFTAVVDYKEVENGTSDKCRVYLRATPNGIRNARPVADKVDYLIEQR